MKRAPDGMSFDSDIRVLVGLAPITPRKMKFLFLFAFAFVACSCFGGDFDNWYFEFHSRKVEIEGTTFSPKREKVGKFSGSSTGEISKDGTHFTEKFDYTYLPENRKISFEVVWTKKRSGVYRAKSVIGDEPEVLCELVVEAENSYQMKITFSNGAFVESKGKLGKNGILSATEVLKTKDGTVLGIMEFQRGPAAAEK